MKSVAISPNSKYLVTGAADCSIRIFDLETKKPVHIFENAHKDWVMGLCISSDSKTLVSSSPDQAIIVWDLVNFKRKIVNEQPNTGDSLNSVSSNELYFTKGWILCMAITPNDSYIVSGSGDSSIRVFNFADLTLFHTFYHAHAGIFMRKSHLIQLKGLFAVLLYQQTRVTWQPDLMIGQSECLI